MAAPGGRTPDAHRHRAPVAQGSRCRCGGRGYHRHRCGRDADRLFRLKQSEKQTDQPTKPQREQVTPETSTATAEQPADTLDSAQPQLFEEAPLEQVLTVLAAHYGVEVEYRTDDVRALRLFYQWEPEYTLDKVVDMLNNFEAFSIRHEGNKLIVEPSNTKESRP